SYCNDKGEKMNTYFYFIYQGGWTSSEPPYPGSDPRITVCLIQKEDTFARGISIRSLRDHFNLDGFELSERRALRALKGRENEMVT
ncbi:MAG: hypothetical protein R6U17_09990, partial [Thermoplasmata archaeon]